MKVILTRRKDIFLSHQQRADIANKNNVDAFISIHINGFGNPSAQGIETYSHPSSKNGRILANYVHSELLKNENMYTVNRGLKTANFAVLRMTKMSAILPELGFISNKKDSDILRNNQDYFAQSIALGILNYVGKNGTVCIDAGHGGTDSGAVGNGLKEKDLNLSIALKVEQILLGKNIEYIVQKGDNLTKIAKKYNTTVRYLVNINNIKNPDLIYEGQKIRIK